MLFQTLDDKKDCVGIYSEGKLVFKEIPSNLTKTWSYSDYLKGENIQYASLYCEGKSLEEACPDYLQTDLKRVNDKLKSFIRSFQEAKISLQDNCFFELTPKKFLEEYCEVKNSITKHVLETVQKPAEYEFYRRMTELLTDIKRREINLDLESLKNDIQDEKTLLFYRRASGYNKNIDFDLFGSITGRLSTKKKSFPIQSLPKSFRRVIKPTNDWFISFDINAAELRTSLALLDKAQPNEEMYEWIRREYIKEDMSRTRTKEIVISWLYDSKNRDLLQYEDRLDRLFDKTSIKEKYFYEGAVHTPFSRKIQADEHHAISYLNQSTFIDIFHRQVLAIDDYLANKASFVAFMVHDELVVDLKDSERELIPDIINLMQNTKYGKFLVNVKAGRNFGEMKQLNIKAQA